jgi:ABC-type uncharacterized transport system auxiliary subunit
MIRRPRMPKCAALALLSVCVFAACAGGPAPVDHFYRLEVAEPNASGGNPLAGTIHVDRLRTDGLIGQRHLLFRESEDSSEIRQHSYHRWSDPPAIALQTALVSFLREADAAQVVMEANSQTRPDYRVSGRVQRFERVLGDSAAIVEIDLTVTGADGALLVHQNYAETRSASDLGESADAIGDAVHGIFERFLVDFRSAASRLQPSQ